MGPYETLRIIDAQGDLVGEDPGLDPELYQTMYRNMVLARTLDRKMLALQRQGRIGTYAMLEGQEAVQIGSALALEPNDFVFPSYREHGVQVTRGLPMEVLLAYWKGLPNAAWDLEKYRTGIVTVPIASQLPHAVGYSYMTQLRGEDTVTVTYFGDLRGRLPLRYELRRCVEDPHCLHLCQQPIRHIGPLREADRLRDDRPEGTGLRVRGSSCRWDGPHRHVPGDEGGRTAGA
jgi:hypothetical protein